MRVGQAEGSTAMIRVFLFLPVSLSAANGNDSPAKFEPPPTQPMTMSAASSAFSICFLASRPMIVWCISTWLSTLPSEYFVSSRVAASSTASLMAMPSEPGEFGSSSRTFLPDCVSGLGLATTCAPHVSIMIRRYGFCW